MIYVNIISEMIPLTLDVFNENNLNPLAATKLLSPVRSLKTLNIIFFDELKVQEVKPAKFHLRSQRVKAD